MNKFEIGDLCKCTEHELLIYKTYDDATIMSPFLSKSIVLSKKNDIFMILNKAEDRYCLGRLLVCALFKDKKGWLVTSSSNPEFKKVTNEL